MLIRITRRKKRSRLVWRALDVMLAVGGLYCLYLGAAGIWSGEVDIFSKRVSGTFTWAEEPAWFAGTVVAWISGGAFLLRIVLAGWREG